MPPPRPVTAGVNDQNPPLQSLYICTYNARSLLSNERLLELKEAISQINYDIIGLAEIRRTGYNIIEDDEHIFCYFGETKGQYGVGFLVKKRHKLNIESFIGISERICILNLKFDNVTMSIIQVYAPTSDASDLEINTFYQQLQQAQLQSYACLIIMGDFNARIGQRISGEERILGNYCYGKRDKRGKTLLEFCWENNLFITNSLFNKNIKNMWTWLSPKKNKSQIDYILTNNKEKITNIEILNSLTFPSDHRFLRSTFSISKIKKSRTNYKTNTSKLKTPKEKEHFVNSLQTKIDKIELEETEDVESFYSKIKKSVSESLYSTSKERVAKQNFISENIKNLIARRNYLTNKKNITKEEREERCYLYKNIHKFIKKELEEHKLKVIEKHLSSSGSLKKGYKSLNTTKQWIPCLIASSTNTKTYSRSKIMETATTFYRNLYATRESYQVSSTRNPNSTTLVRFSTEEIMKKMECLNSDKCTGPDGIPNEAIKTGRFVLAPPLTALFNMILDSRKIPKEWAESDIILLYKKGNPADITNYRPISLQSNIYKLFASCLEDRITTYTEKYQPPEQAGFRKNFSTTEHIHTIDSIIEKYEEHKRPLYLAFIDYAKAFDSISHNSMWKALEDCNIPDEVIELIKDIYHKSVSRVKMESKGAEINICRGVRQGDPLSPRIFITILENIMKNLRWETKGINVKGEFLSNLRFADDIVLFSETPKQLEKMINELDTISRQIGLELNTTKTKVMTNNIHTPIKVNNIILEYVASYIYLGKEISFKKSRNTDEIDRRIALSWNKFWSNKELLKSRLPLKLKKKILDSCILPCLSYGCQTWIYNNYTKNKIQVCQRAMERSILNIKRRDRKRNTVIRQSTNVIDALNHCKKLKWKWAGHIARMEDNKWIKKIITWTGPQNKRTRGRPKERWLDEITKSAGKDWLIKAQDRKAWSKMEEAFTR